MKEKILYLVIGVLIGAIITTGVFMVLNKNQKNVGPGGRGGQNFDRNNIPEGMENRIMEMPNRQGEEGTTSFATPAE